MTECKICLFDDSIVQLDEHGVCEYCNLQDKLRYESKEQDWQPILKKIKKSGEGNRYDCLIGISGGEDSSVLLYLAVKIWGLRPLVIHFNNRTNRPEADHNIKLLTEKLNVNFIEYFLDKGEYDKLTDALLKAGVPDCDIANDVCMSKMMYSAAKDNDIKYILNGHDFRNEGSSPKKWSFIDYTYLNDIYKTYNREDLKNYPLLTVWDQIWGAIIGIKQVRPYHYSDHNRAEILNELKSIGWKDYGGKHNENIYTAFIGNYVLPKKFRIDKRRTYLSAQIREGVTTKEAAKEILKTPAEFNLNDLGSVKDHLLKLVDYSPKQPRSNFKQTNFKMLKPLFWVLKELGIFPKTAYAKYCK
jgi:hypothetical protein